jgi:hypothetical protein
VVITESSIYSPVLSRFCVAAHPKNRVISPIETNNCTIRWGLTMMSSPFPLMTTQVLAGKRNWRVKKWEQAEF